MGTRSAAIQIRPPTAPPSLNPLAQPVVPSSSAYKPLVTDRTSPESKPSSDLYSNETGLPPSPRPPYFRNVSLYGISAKRSEKESVDVRTGQQVPSLNGRKSSPSSPRKFSLPHPTRPATATPTGFSGATLTTNAPIFVPSGVLNQQSPAKTGQSVKLNMAAAEFEPSGLPALNDPNTAMYSHSTTSDPASSYKSTSSTPYPPEPQYQPHNPYAYDTDHLHHHPHQDNHNFNDGYINHSLITGPSLSNFQRPLNYHLYAPPLPHSSNQHPTQLAINRFFMPASIRETLQRKCAATLQGPTHEVARTPEDLGVYHSLVVIDSPKPIPNATIPQHSSFSLPPPGGGVGTGSLIANLNANLPNNKSSHTNTCTSKVLKNPAWIYKAFCSLDGKAYCLYRIEGFQLKQGQGEVAIGQVEKWRKIRHPAIVNIREAFTTRAFGDQSIIFAFDYHPLSQNLYDEHISSKKKPAFGFGNSHSAGSELDTRINSNPVTRYAKHRTVINGNLSRAGMVEEKIIWSYIAQIANAIRVVHKANLAVRTIEPSKILLTGPKRLRINGCGILDVLEYSPTQSLIELQSQDLYDFGCLICSIASCTDCSTRSGNLNGLTKALEYTKQYHSRELNEVIDYLLRRDGLTESPLIDSLLEMILQHGFEEMTRVFNHNDLLEECLSRELENGRLVRLMSKLGFINERPEFDHDPNWSETSDRYLLKLFRDYVFHQVDGLGKPVTDLSHVLSCLNKLDAGLDEKITLISRDEQTCAIVSYAEIKRIIDTSFRDLTR